MRFFIWRARTRQTTPPQDPPESPPPTYLARYLEHTIPTSLPGSSRRTFRVRVRNTGTAIWRRNPPDNRFVGLAVFLNGELATTGRSSREEVAPGEETVICFTLTLPPESGAHEVRCDMVAHTITMFSDAGTTPLVVRLETTAREQTASERLMEEAERSNFWFFTPGLGVHLSHGEAVYPLFAAKANGCHITDLEGREYVDYVMGWGCALLGYGHPAIQQALSEAVHEPGILTLTHPLEIEVSRLLCEMIPSAEMALFGKNGSDVCTAAVRMARAFTNRKKILLCGYHGWHDWFAEQYGFTGSGVPEHPERLVHRFAFNDLGNLRALLDAHGGSVAAVMLEPSGPVEGIQGPLDDADPDFLQQAGALARSHGALLIFDEIMTGFRYPEGSVQKALGVTPDLTCLGKALSAGMPLSAVVGRREIFTQTLHRIAYTPTFKGEVYSFAAARAALRLYRETDVPGHICGYGQRLKEGVTALCGAHGVPARMIGPPFRMTIAFGERHPERQTLMRTLMQQELTRQGVLTFKGFMLPSLAHDDTALAKTLQAFDAALGVLTDSLADDSLLRRVEIPDVC